MMLEPDSECLVGEQVLAYMVAGVRHKGRRCGHGMKWLNLLCGTNARRGVVES